MFCKGKVSFFFFFFKKKPRYLFRKICSLGMLKCPFFRVSLVAQTVKNLPAMWRPGFDSWVGKIPWRRNWQSTPAFLPGESHGQRSLAGCSPRGYRVRHDCTHMRMPFLLKITVITESSLVSFRVSSLGTSWQCQVRSAPPWSLEGSPEAPWPGVEGVRGAGPPDEQAGKAERRKPSATSGELHRDPPSLGLQMRS